MGWRTRRAAGGLAGAALLVAGGASPAAAAPSTDRPPYEFTVRAAPVEHYLEYFRELVQDVGFSRVQLTHAAGDATGHARAVGAAYWLLTDDEPCLLGCEPPCPEPTLINPTVARTANPRECTDRIPGPGALGLPTTPAAAVPAAHTAARTPTEQSADAACRVGSLGSSSAAAFDRTADRFTGNASSFVADVALPGGGAAAVASTMSVSAVPNAVPAVSYRLSLTTWRDGTSSSGIDEQRLRIAGQQIPLTELVGRVNAQLAALGRALSQFAQLGIAVLAPATSYRTDDSRFRVTAPVVVIGAGRDLASPTPLRGTGLRLGSAVFSGAFSAPDPPLR